MDDQIYARLLEKRQLTDKLLLQKPERMNDLFLPKAERMDNLLLQRPWLEPDGPYIFLDGFDLALVPS